MSEQRTPEEIAQHIGQLRAALAGAEAEAATLTRNEPKPVTVEEIDAKIQELTKQREKTAEELHAEKLKKHQRLPMSFFIPQNMVSAVAGGEIQGLRIVESFPKIAGPQ